MFSFGIIFLIQSGCAQITSIENNQSTAAEYTLNLYENERVHFHTRSSFSDWKECSTGPFTSFLDKIGALVVVRHVKISDETPWWVHNSIPNIFECFKEVDLTKGRATIIYYRHSEDSQIAHSFPEWISIDQNGDEVKSKRGITLCLNSPYRDSLFTRLQLIVESGFPILYFDDRHIFTKRCYCSDCQSLFQNWKSENTQYIGDVSDYAFTNFTISNFFGDLSKSLNKNGLQHQLLVSGNNWPALSDLHLNRAMWEQFTLKTEIAIPLRANRRGKLRATSKHRNELTPSIYYRFLFSHLLQASHGSPHVWIPFISTESGLNKQVSGIVALGGIANVDLNEEVLQMESSLRTLIQEIRPYSSHLIDLRPFGTKTVLFDEEIKWNLAESPNQFWSDYVIPKTQEYADYNAAGHLVCTVSPQRVADSLHPAYSSIRIQETDGLWMTAFSNPDGEIIITLCRDFLNDIYFPDRLKPPGINQYPDSGQALHGSITFSVPGLHLSIEELSKGNVLISRNVDGRQVYSVSLQSGEYFKAYKLSIKP